MIQLLLEAGADINTQGGNYGSGLQAAACYGRKESVQLLLEAGADVNAQRYYGNSLQAAACNGSEESVPLLIVAGADTKIQGGYYGNALEAAARGGSKKAVQLLLEAGAEVIAQGGEDGNSLQAARANLAYYEEGEAKYADTIKIAEAKEIIQLLLDAGAKDITPPPRERKIKGRKLQQGITDSLTPTDLSA